MSYPESLKKLISTLQKLPGVGPKTAERYALHLTNTSPQDARELAATLTRAADAIIHCALCCNVADTSPCAICRNATRDTYTICVVAAPSEVIAFERTGEYRGAYHVLQGVLNPLDGIGPDRIRIAELLTRISKGGVKEIIFGITPTVEGELTTTYIAKLLQGKNITLTRIARGLPFGASIEYADDATLAHALNERKMLQTPHMQ